MPLPYEVDDPFLQDNLDELDRRTSHQTAGSNEQSVIAFTNGWGNYQALTGSTSFPDLTLWKQADGTVFITGLITKAPYGAANFVLNEVMFIVPINFRPARIAMLHAIYGNAASSSYGFARIDVYPNGDTAFVLGTGGANPVGHLAFHHFWKGA